MAARARRGDGARVRVHLRRRRQLEGVRRERARGLSRGRRARLPERPRVDEGRRAPLRAVGSYTHAKIKPEYLEMFPRPAHLPDADGSTIRFGHLFPNLIPCCTRRSSPTSASTRWGPSGSA
jgi:hypothetical protein